MFILIRAAQYIGGQGGDEYKTLLKNILQYYITTFLILIFYL